MTGSSKKFWDKIFYKAPKDWEELKLYCKKFCNHSAPSYFLEKCQSCQIIRDCLENMDVPLLPRPSHLKYPESLLGKKDLK